MKLLFSIATLASLAHASDTTTDKVDRSLRGVASSKHRVRSLQQSPSEEFFGDDDFSGDPDLGPGAAGPDGLLPSPSVDMFAPGDPAFGDPVPPGGLAVSGPDPFGGPSGPDPAFGDPVPPGGSFPGPQGGPGLGPGESNCIPHPSLDGTLFCGFRTQNGVADVVTNSNTNTHLSCITDNNLGYQYCANIGMYLQPDPNGNMPPPPGVVGPGPMGPGWWSDSGPSDSFDSGPSFDGGPSFDSGPSEDLFAPVPGFTHPPNVGCPMIRPMGGDHCNGWLRGGTENSCHYEQTLCLCESLVYGWQCNGAALSSYVVPIP